MTRVGPQTRAWITREARREAGMNELSEQTAVAAVRANVAVLGIMNNADIEAVAFLVLMEAGKGAQEDLKTIMAGVKRIKDTKAGMRQANSNARTEPNRLRNPSQPPAAAAVRPPPAALSATIQPKPVPKAELDAKLAAAKNNLDSLSEMGETESLRLQMSMDRMSKLMSTLSNLLKRISDTSSSITQNLK